MPSFPMPAFVWQPATHRSQTFTANTISNLARKTPQTIRILSDLWIIDFRNDHCFSDFSLDFCSLYILIYSLYKQDGKWGNHGRYIWHQTVCLVSLFELYFLILWRREVTSDDEAAFIMLGHFWEWDTSVLLKPRWYSLASLWNVPGFNHRGEPICCNLRS